jgi:hypothetical protein
MPLYETDKPLRTNTAHEPPLLTLDTNCLISLAKNQPDAADIRKLMLRNDANQIRLRVVAASASERTPGGQSLANYEEFQQFLASLRLGHLPVLLPLAIWGVAFWDYGLSADDGPSSALLDQIWEILFGTAPRLLRDGNPDRNRLCDALMIWAHIHHGGDVFVTSDRHFHAYTKKQRLLEIGAGEILTPAEAAAKF